MFNKIKQLFTEYFTLGNYVVSQTEAEAAIREAVSFKGPNIFVLIVAILMASLGLNVNSTAVIIGAMLISPLMGPIIGIGLGIGVQDFDLLKTCLRNLMMAAGFSIVASTLYFLISPVSEGHSELLARTSPSIYDVLIGFFGGTAGIIGICSRSKGNVIPGVAIATALMPPLCTVGYGIATLQPAYFLGAAYLFLINSVYIALATYIGVKLMKFTPASTPSPEQAKRTHRIIYVIAIVVMIPSIYMTWTMLRQANYETRVRKFVTTECVFPQTRVLTHSTTVNDGIRTIDITLIGRSLSVDSLQLALSSRLGYYGLQGTHINIFQGTNDVMQNVGMPSNDIKNIYDIAQSTITNQQMIIDSLKTVISTRSAVNSYASEIAPELKVIFPEVNEIALNRSYFSSADSTGRIDTVDIALINYSTAIQPSRENKLREYLEARVKQKVKIVSVDNSVIR
ncbi:MAG: DUF389 domain-containing protein [Muribaculaceae bacterium]|nr:DUF389 domain-containing protein [Muribaculaceae bacterium]